MFIGKCFISRMPLADHAALPTDDDLLFIYEQLWLGGINDAAYRFAFHLNCHCGGRVSEVTFNMFCNGVNLLTNFSYIM